MPSREPAMLMWAEACELLDRADRLQRQFFRPSRSAAWEPPIDVFETEHAVWNIAALPGVRANQLDIAIAADSVIIAGERSLPVQSRAIIHRLEIPHGRFERRIALPAGRYDVERRDLADGCLILGLRKLG
jgi:HSP20 family protein